MQPNTLRSQARRHRSSSISRSVPRGMPPALLTRMSTCLQAAATVFTCALSVRSAGGPRANVLRYPVELRGGARGKVEVTTFGSQRMGDGQSDALRAPGDERRSAGEIKVQLLISRDNGSSSSAPADEVVSLRQVRQ